MIEACYVLVVFFMYKYMAANGSHRLELQGRKNKWVKFWVSSPFVSLDTGLCNLKGLTAIHVQGREVFYPTEKLPLCTGFITMIYLFST